MLCPFALFYKYVLLSKRSLKINYFSTNFDRHHIRSAFFVFNVHRSNGPQYVLKGGGSSVPGNELPQIYGRFPKVPVISISVFDAEELYNAKTQS